MSPGPIPFPEHAVTRFPAEVVERRLVANIVADPSNAHRCWTFASGGGQRTPHHDQRDRYDRDLLDLFLSATEDYGIILLDADGRIHRWSRGAERLFGFTAHEVVGTSAHEIFVPADRKAGVPEVELQMAKQQGRAEDERWHLRKDGTASGPQAS